MIKLLIVDDEKMIRMGIKNGIDWDELGIDEVLVAGSVSEALPIILNDTPDILLVDIQMGKVSGIDLIKQIRELKIEIRIIVMTGFERFDYAQTCLRLQVHEFLLKPMDEDVLMGVILDQVEEIKEEKSKQLLRNELKNLDEKSFEKYYFDIVMKMKENIDIPVKVKELFHECESVALSAKISDEILDKYCFQFVLEVFYKYFEESKIQSMSLEKMYVVLKEAEKEKKMTIVSSFIDNLLGINERESSFVINNIKTYVRQHVADNLTVTSLAEEFNMNATYLSRMFKQETGEGCNAYITRMKIEKAQYLLRNTDMKINEISETTGFSDSNYFCLVFKKNVGVSPSQYKKSKE